MSGNAMRKSFLLGAVSAIVMPAGSMAYAGDDASQDGVALEEIIVTASKRSKSLQAVAMSVKAIGADEIDTRGLQGMGDYMASIPSVAYNEKGGGRNQIDIRGVSSGVSAGGSTTVGYYFGEIPVSAMARGNPDIKLFDIERVEILRGPQGTLYGSGSMGGAVKVIPKSADLNEVSGSFEATLSNTAKGGTNYNFSGAVNLPVIEGKLAVRAVGYHYENTGFVDNHISGGGAYGITDKTIDNVSSETTSGGRISFRLKVSEDIIIDGTAITQYQDVDGLGEITPPTDNWSQNRWTPEALSDDFKVANLTVNYTGQMFDIMVSASYMNRQWRQSRDLHAANIFSALPDAPIRLFDRNEDDLYVQEVRITSTDDSPLQWILGGFHLKKNLNFTNGLDWFGSNESAEASFLGQVFGVTADTPMHQRDNDISDEQFAVYGEVSYQATDTLEAVAGLRWFTYDNTQNLRVFGIFQNNTSTLNTSASTTTPKFALNFTPTEDSLYYVSATNGFRPGRAARPLPDVCQADLNAAGFSEQPDGTTPDSLWSYEAGTKQTLADGRVAFNAAVFYIDWTNIPTSILLNCGFSFIFNASTATSRGIEMDLSAQITENLRIDIAGSYTDAVLDDTLDPATGDVASEGGRTPGIPHVNLTMGAQYNFLLSDTWESLVRLDAHYVGSYSNLLPSSAIGTDSGNYTVVNLRWSTEFDGWSAEIFANNILDATVNIVVDTEFQDGRVYRGRPRTIGGRIRYNF